jgi:hypothetical protein
VQSLGIVSTDEIRNTLDNVLGNRVYQMLLPQDPVYPNLVYRLVSSISQVDNGYHITQSDKLYLFVRDTTIDGLEVAVAEVRTAIEASSWSIEVQDMWYDFDENQSIYVARIEVDFTIPALSSQTLPAATVYPVETTADRSPFGNHVRQLEQQAFAVVIISDSVEIETLRREVQAALLGKQVHETQIQYQRGVALDGGGGLMLWQEIFTDGLYIEQT